MGRAPHGQGFPVVGLSEGGWPGAAGALGTRWPRTLGLGRALRVTSRAPGLQKHSNVIYLFFLSGILVLQAFLIAQRVLRAPQLVGAGTPLARRGGHPRGRGAQVPAAGRDIGLPQGWGPEEEQVAPGDGARGEGGDQTREASGRSRGRAEQ